MISKKIFLVSKQIKGKEDVSGTSIKNGVPLTDVSMELYRMAIDNYSSNEPSINNNLYKPISIYTDSIFINLFLPIIGQAPHNLKIINVATVGNKIIDFFTMEVENATIDLIKQVSSSAYSKQISKPLENLYDQDFIANPSQGPINLNDRSSVYCQDVGNTEHVKGGNINYILVMINYSGIKFEVRRIEKNSSSGKICSEINKNVKNK